MPDKDILIAIDRMDLLKSEACQTRGKLVSLVNKIDDLKIRVNYGKGKLINGFKTLLIGYEASGALPNVNECECGKHMNGTILF
ncbi:hypothetical protein GCM10028809_59420 [Spirosoma gilvum]